MVPEGSFHEKNTEETIIQLCERIDEALRDVSLFPDTKAREGLKNRLSQSSTAELRKLINPYISELREDQPHAALRLSLLREVLESRL